MAKQQTAHSPQNYYSPGWKWSDSQCVQNAKWPAYVSSSKCNVLKTKNRCGIQLHAWWTLYKHGWKNAKSSALLYRFHLLLTWKNTSWNTSLFLRFPWTRDDVHDGHCWINSFRLKKHPRTSSSLKCTCIFSRCTLTSLNSPHKGSLCIHLFCIYIRGCCRPRSVRPAWPGQPVCLAAGEPSDRGRVRDSAWAWQGGGGVGRSQWCHRMPGNLSLCVSVTSALLSLWPPAKYSWLTGLDCRAGRATFTLSPNTQCLSLARLPVTALSHHFTSGGSRIPQPLNGCLGNVRV